MGTTVTLIYPNGGENLKVGDQVHIQWSSSGATAHRVQYSLDGSSYTPIVTGLSGSARDYLWTILKDVLPGWPIDGPSVAPGRGEGRRG